MKLANPMPEFQTITQVHQVLTVHSCTSKQPNLSLCEDTASESQDHLRKPGPTPEKFVGGQSRSIPHTTNQTTRSNDPIQKNSITSVCEHGLSRLILFYGVQFLLMDLVIIFYQFFYFNFNFFKPKVILFLRVNHYCYCSFGLFFCQINSFTYLTDI